MDKKILSFKGVEEAYDTVMFQGQVITVKKRLSISDVAKLVDVYVSEYFSSEESNAQLVFAELGFKSTLFDLVSDTAIGDGEYSAVIETSLLDDVKNKVVNLDEVYEIIEKTIRKIENKNSVSNTIASLGEKLKEAIDTFSNSMVNQELVDSMGKIITEAKAISIDKDIPTKTITVVPTETKKKIRKSKTK